MAWQILNYSKEVLETKETRDEVDNYFTSSIDNELNVYWYDEYDDNTTVFDSIPSGSEIRVVKEVIEE